MTVTLKQKGRAELSRILALYFGILVFVGIIKFIIISDYIPLEYLSAARISAITSLVVSSLIAIVVLVLIVGIVYFCNIAFEFEIEEYNMLDSFNCAMYIFLTVELLKLVLCFFFLEDSVRVINMDGNVDAQLKASQWYFYNSILTYCMIFMGGIVFAVDMYFNKKYRNILNLGIVSGILVLGLYVSTIDFF